MPGAGLLDDVDPYGGGFRSLDLGASRAAQAVKARAVGCWVARQESTIEHAPFAAGWRVFSRGNERYSS